MGMRRLDQQRKDKTVNPVSPKATIKAKPEDSLTIQVELITPLFGGGVKAGVVDGKHWLRASEIKAGMRFWWRVLFGRGAATPEAMWTAEGLLFGRPAKYRNEDGGQMGGAGIFTLEVAAEEVRASLDAKNYAKPNTPESVAYFAAAVAPIKTLLGPGDGKLVGKLHIRWREKANDQGRHQVLKSLAAFLAFGGVGSRTRKGAGALAPFGLEDAIRLKHYPVRGFSDLDMLKPEKPLGSAVQNPACFFGGHGSVELMQACGNHRTLLCAWKEVRKASRALALQDSPFEPRLPLGLPLSTKKGPKSTKATDRLASPVWGGVTRVWPEWNPKGPAAQRVNAATSVLFLLGDPPAFGPVPVNSRTDLEKIRRLIKSVLESMNFKTAWSISDHE